MTLFCYIGLILFITFLLFCCPIQYVLPIPIKAPKYLFVIIFLVNKQKKMVQWLSHKYFKKHSKMECVFT